MTGLTADTRAMTGLLADIKALIDRARLTAAVRTNVIF